MKNLFLLILGVFLLQSCSNIRFSNQMVRDDVYYQPNEPIITEDYYTEEQVTNTGFYNYDQVYYDLSRFSFNVYPTWNWQPYSGFWIYEPFYFNRWGFNSWNYNWWNYNYWNRYYWGYNYWGFYNPCPYPNYWHQYPNIYGGRVHYGPRPSLNTSLIQPRKSVINSSLLNTGNKPSGINTSSTQRNYSTTPKPSRDTRSQYSAPRTTPTYTRPTTPSRPQYTTPNAPRSITPQSRPATTPSRPPSRTSTPVRSSPTRTSPQPSRISK